MPGHTYYKDPTVTVVEGSESSYVRMLVTISKAKDVEAVFKDGFIENTDWNKKTDPSKWELIPTEKGEDGHTDAVADTITYEFRYKEAVAAPNEKVLLDDLFEKFTVPGKEVNNEDLDKLQDMTITVVAHAIQADGFNRAGEAWVAFSAN